MKKIFTFLAVVIISISVFAQAPEKMSYQAVIRDVDNMLVSNQPVGMLVSILQGSSSGTAVYVEIQLTATNTNGLVSIEIGDGTVVNGDFTSIDWADGSYFIKVETDPTGGANYTITGTSQLLSVPYALHAKSSETITGTITETDPVFTAWDKSTGITITESQISDLGNYIETESDPVFGSSVASGITATDTTNWNNKLDTETDPVFGSSVASGITAADTAYWNNILVTETDPIFGSSVASDITTDDITNWDNKLDTEIDPAFLVWDKSTGIIITESQISDFGNYIEAESQTLSDVLLLNNDGNALQIKNISDPTDVQDAATKFYVDELKTQVDELKSQILELQILTGIVVVDIEGNAYGTVTIGTQVWMAENLKTTKYNDGTDIPLVTDNTEWSNTTTSAYCWYNNDQTTYGDTYGALYNWYAAVENLCPTGWHVPDNDEWTTLINNAGGPMQAGCTLKEAGTEHWIYNPDGTNEFGFTALPGGARYADGLFEYTPVGEIGAWQSATESGTNNAWFQVLSTYLCEFQSAADTKKYGVSIRCIKD